MTLCFAAATLPTRQAPKNSCFVCSRLMHKTPSSVAAKKAPPTLTLSAQGKALDQHREFHCQAKQGQRATAQQGGPDISRLDPDLQEQWDHAANADLGSVKITAQSNKKVGWICNQCPDGHLHSWSATVSNRANGNGCPQCSGKKVCKHNSLATKAPSVAAQWDHAANDGTPDDITAYSNKHANWHCNACGHKWRAIIFARVSKLKSGCPRCAKIARTARWTKHPTIAEDPCLLAQWDHSRNAEQGHFPNEIRLRSNKQIFWLCDKCPKGQQHSWSAQPNSRTGASKAGCPCCSGHAACKCNSLQELFPTIAADWDHVKNATQPSDHTAGSHFMAWWCSPQHGSWQQTINSRTNSIQKRSVRSKRAQQR